jgi:hypothetical protein
MKRLLACLLGSGVIASAAFAGVGYSGKEMKQVAAPPPCPQWYADYEFNLSLWGTYVFTGNEWENDRYLETDHAWGGGGDFKYFFMRYFGVGIEGWAVNSRQAFNDVSVDFPDVFPPTAIVRETVRHEDQTVGAVLGTLTLRYPIPCTRFSPYIFGEAARSSAVASERSLSSLIRATLLRAYAPTVLTVRQRRLARSAGESKFVSRHTSAGSVISVGTSSMVQTTTSAWFALA